VQKAVYIILSWDDVASSFCTRPSKAVVLLAIFLHRNL
jgi:hypothetical protein